MEKEHRCFIEELFPMFPMLQGFPDHDMWFYHSINHGKCTQIKIILMLQTILAKIQYFSYIDVNYKQKPAWKSNETTGTIKSTDR